MLAKIMYPVKKNGVIAILTNIPRQSEIFERTLDLISNGISGFLTLFIVYWVYYVYEEQKKEEEKLEKQELKKQFQTIKGN